MATDNHTRSNILVIEKAEPLSTLITIENGQEILVTVGNDSESDEAARNALGVFGAWSDLNWDEAAEALDRIRHDNAPTPSVDE